MSLLLYPQIVLTFWAPLLIWLLTWATRHWRQSLAPRDGFRVSLGLLLLPLLVWWVPYLPHLPLRDALPYRVPVAWGVYNGGPGLSQAEWWLVTLPAVMVFGSMVLAWLYGLAEEIVARWRVRHLPQQQAGGVTVLDVPGDLAFTMGLLRPRIYLSRAVWEGPHRAAVLAHEQAHAHSRHGLWLALARWSRRTSWPWRWMGSLLHEVQTWAELVADERAIYVVGKPALTRALKALLPCPAPAPALSFTAPDTLTHRVQRLLRPSHALSVLSNVSLALLFLILLVLF